MDNRFVWDSLEKALAWRTVINVVAGLAVAYGPMLAKVDFGVWTGAVGIGVALITSLAQTYLRDNAKLPDPKKT